MGCLNITLRLLGLGVFGAVAFFAYVRFYLVNFYHSRDHNSPTDRQSALQMIFEGYELLNRNRPDLTAFEKGMYDKVASSNPPLKNKVVILTGATKGLGRGMAGHLAAFGATLVLPCRRCNFEQFKEQVKKDVQLVYEMYGPKTGKKKLEYIPDVHVFDLDLADLDQIDAFVEWYASKTGLGPADLLINNAGMVTMYPTRTKQGFETTFAVNFFAAAYLTEKLLEKNLIRGKIVAVSSEDHRESKTIEEVLRDEKVKFGQFWGHGLIDAMSRYGYSKLLETTYFLALSRRIPNPVIELCPGPIASDIPMAAMWPLNIIAKTAMDWLFLSIYQASLPVLRLALDEKFAKTSGVHFHIAEERPARADARDVKIQDQVYNWTKELIRTKRAPE